MVEIVGSIVLTGMSTLFCGRSVVLSFFEGLFAKLFLTFPILSCHFNTYTSREFIHFLLQFCHPLLKTGIGTLQTGIGTLQTSIGTLQAGIGTLQTGIGTLQTGIGTLKFQIARGPWGNDHGFRVVLSFL